MPITTAMLTVVLAVIFLASGVSKLRARHQSAIAFTALRIRVPAPVAMIMAVSVTEVVLAVALLASSGWWFVAASLAAVTLLVAFLVVVARASRLGSRDLCNCFGPGTSDRIGSRLVVRNALLVVAAGVVAGPSLISTPTSSTLFFAFQPVAEGFPLAILATTMLIAALTFTIGSGDPASPDPSASVSPAVDEAAPIILVDAKSGRVVDLRHDAQTKAQLAVFVKPGCTPCIDVISEIESIGDDLSRVVDISLIRDQAVGTTLLESHAPHVASQPSQLVDLGGESATRLGVWSRRPAAVLIATDQSVVQPIAGGRDEVISLIDSIRAAAGHLRVVAGDTPEKPNA